MLIPHWIREHGNFISSFSTFLARLQLYFRRKIDLKIKRLLQFANVYEFVVLTCGSDSIVDIYFEVIRNRVRCRKR